MKEQYIPIFKELFKVVEKVGNIFTKSPPWNKEAEKFKHDIRNSKQYYIWRAAVLRRDNYTCVKCGDDRKSKLQVDHIKPFSLCPELRFAIDNGRTLCEECHKTTDTFMNRWAFRHIVATSKGKATD